MTAAAANTSVDTALKNLVGAGATTLQQVIVRAQPGQYPELRKYVRHQKDWSLVRELRRTNALVVLVPLTGVTTLASQTALVRSVSIDAVVKANDVSAGSGPVNLVSDTLGLSSASLRGTGVGVAVIDSGIYPSFDLAGRITGFYDFVKGNGRMTPAYDDYGHGTHVAGLIASSGALSRGAHTGVAPGVNLIGMKVLDKHGKGKVSDVIAAVEFAAENKATLGIDVINLSLGHVILESSSTDPLVLAIQNAVQTGIVVVVSAGNTGVNPDTGLPGYGGILSPANAPAAITVGSQNMQRTSARGDDTVNNYSSRGPTWFDRFAKPDVVAPGYQLVSVAAPGSHLATTYPSRLVADASGNLSYITLSGTSMAAAVTSGLAALAIEANRTAFTTTRPAITPNAVKAILEFTALSLRDPSTLTAYDPLIQGTGSINAAGTLTLAKSIDTSIPWGAWWLVEGVDPSSTIDGTSYPWAQSILWGNAILWGNSVYTNDVAWSYMVPWGTTFWGNNILWGNSTLWGNSILWGNNILWGNDIVSGSGILWGNSVLWGRNVVDGNGILWGNNLCWGNGILWGNALAPDNDAFTTGLSVLTAAK